MTGIVETDPEKCQILAVFLPTNFKRKVDNLGVKEFWIWTYHYGFIEPAESNMSSPVTGDISNSERYNDDLPIYDHTYVVFNYNFTRTQSEAVHNHGHQLEAILMYLNKLQDGNTDLFLKKFVGQDNFGNFITGRCGWTHMPPNTRKDYDYLNPALVLSDIEDWTPEGTGNKKLVNVDTWGNLVFSWPEGVTDFPTRMEAQWYIYWMQNMPGHHNCVKYNENYMTNWWLFTADWDLASTTQGLYSSIPNCQIIDNLNSEFSSGQTEWKLSSYIPGGYDTYYHYAPPGDGSRWAKWSFYIPSLSNWEIFAQWTSHENRSPESPYTIINNGASYHVPANQKVNGGQFNSLGTFLFEAGPVEVVLNDTPTGYVIADAVKIVIQDDGIRHLDHIDIEGPSILNENSAADYICRAYYTDDSNLQVSADSWSENCSAADINAVGYLTAYEVSSDENCTIEATYSEDGIAVQDTHHIHIHDTDAPQPTKTIIDNANSGFSSGPNEWQWSSHKSGGYDTYYQYAPPGNGSRWAKWTFSVASSGNCEVLAQWTSFENRVLSRVIPSAKSQLKITA